MLSILIILSIPLLIALVYLYLKWKYFTLYGAVPGIQPEFLFGNLRQLDLINSKKEMIDSYVHGFEKMHNQYGDTFQFWIGANHCYAFCRPEHAEQIYAARHIFDRAEIRKNTFGLIAENALIALMGPAYKRHAKAVLPMLRKNRFLSQISTMTNYVDQLIEVWKERYENQDNIIATCITDDNQQLLLDVFTRLTFDYDFGNLKRLLQAARQSNPEGKVRTSNFTAALITWLDAYKRVGTNGMPFLVNYYLLKFDKKYQSALRVLEDYAEGIISKCREETEVDAKPMNLVASLVSSLQQDESLEKFKSEEDKTGITKKELLDEVLSLILGGFETTASTISWMIYYLSKQPEIQQKMKNELKRDGITKQTLLEDLDLSNQCEYIDCVIKETLRIAPLTIGSPRTLTEDTVIDGIRLRQGDNVLVAFSLMQNDRRYWNLDPSLFIPERFYGDDAPDRNHHPFAFSPFGNGHRACAGQDLARLELKVIAIRLMLFVTFADAPGNNGGHRQRLSIMPKELAVYMKFD